MKLPLVLAAPLALVLLGAADPPAPVATPAPVAAAERVYYPEDADGKAVLRAALADARAKRKIAVIVFGADWCHDSRALARVLLSPEFKNEFGDRFAVTFIDVGTPQVGQGRNLDLVRRYGVPRLKSTPAMFAVSPRGRLLNTRADALHWRKAEKIGKDATLAWFRKLARTAR